MGPDDPLVLTFDPQTVDHLGAKMYSHLPNALAELIANAYDADARSVLIKLESEGSISITDDGHGMSRQDVAEKYLRIGRNRRASEATEKTESGRRLVSGKKGLGKLALFGIGKTIELATTREGSEERTLVALSYDDMKESTGDYHPAESQAPISAESHGTRVRLKDLKRTSNIDATELAASLSRLFNYMDSEFSISVIAQDGTAHRVTPDSRLAAVDVEFEWHFPEDFIAEDEYASSRAIQGWIVSSSKPLRQGMRGITLYVNGRLANEPEFFGASESSFAYSYLTGYLICDYLDGLDPDVIATDRRAIDWETPETLQLRAQLQRLLLRVGQEWRARRSAKKRETNEDVLGGSTDEWVESIRAEEQQQVRDLVEAIESDEIDMSPDQQGTLLKLVQQVAPKHAEYVWRHLHPSIQDATEKYYIAGDYYTAVQEAIKRFVSETKTRSGTSESTAHSIVSQAFGDNGKLNVFERYMNDSAFDAQTAKNVENGQKFVSMGVVSGFRNPLAHEEVQKLHDSGAFNHDDCLDALSIISHLMRRLGDAIPAAGEAS